MALIMKLLQKLEFFLMDFWMSTHVGGNQAMCGNTNLDCTKMGSRVSHPYQCVQCSTWCYVRSKSNRKMQPTNCVRILIMEQCGEKLHHNQKGNFGDGVCSSQILQLPTR
jgi:hypothetical protein